MDRNRIIVLAWLVFSLVILGVAGYGVAAGEYQALALLFAIPIAAMVAGNELKRDGD